MSAFTPRFGEIAADTLDSSITTIIKKELWDSILKALVDISNIPIYAIWIGSKEYCSIVVDGVGHATNMLHRDIYLIDNYFNKYKYTRSPNVVEVITTHPFIDIIKTTSMNNKYDTLLSDEEISYIKQYCTIEDADHMAVLKLKMKDYLTSHNRTIERHTILTEVYSLNRAAEERITSLLKRIEELETTNMLYRDSMKNMAHKTIKLEKKQDDDSRFIAYLKHLFVWN